MKKQSISLPDLLYPRICSRGVKRERKRIRCMQGSRSRQAAAAAACERKLRVLFVRAGSFVEYFRRTNNWIDSLGTDDDDEQRPPFSLLWYSPVFNYSHSIFILFLSLNFLFYYFSTIFRWKRFAAPTSTQNERERERERRRESFHVNIHEALL